MLRMFDPKFLAVCWSVLTFYLGISISAPLIADGFRELTPILSVRIPPAFIFDFFGIDTALLCSLVFVWSSAYFLSSFMQYAFGLKDDSFERRHPDHFTVLAVAFIILNFLLVFTSLSGGHINIPFGMFMKAIVVTMAYLCTMSAVVYINFSLWLKV